MLPPCRRRRPLHYRPSVHSFASLARLLLQNILSPTLFGSFHWIHPSIHIHPFTLLGSMDSGGGGDGDVDVDSFPSCFEKFLIRMMEWNAKETGRKKERPGMIDLRHEWREREESSDSLEQFWILSLSVGPVLLVHQKRRLHHCILCKIYNFILDSWILDRWIE